MTHPRNALAALALWAPLAAVLAACPLPQPVPAIEGGVTITPPRFLTESMVPAESVVRVGTDCAPDDFVPFGGIIDDASLDDPVEARWFVDYGPGAVAVWDQEVLAVPPDVAETRRALTDFQLFYPASFTPGPHVVEVVVSNGFYPIGSVPAGSPPNRTPQPGYETQVFRWLVVYEPGGRCE